MIKDVQGSQRPREEKGDPRLISKESGDHQGVWVYSGRIRNELMETNLSSLFLSTLALFVISIANDDNQDP